METSIYRLKIDCDDDIILIVYFDWPKESEHELLEYFYEKYFNAQPDISKYIVTDVTKEYELKREYKPSASFHLAIEGLEYAAKFN